MSPAEAGPCDRRLCFRRRRLRWLAGARRRLYRRRAWLRGRGRLDGSSRRGRVGRRRVGSPVAESLGDDVLVRQPPLALQSFGQRRPEHTDDKDGVVVITQSGEGPDCFGQQKIATILT